MSQIILTIRRLNGVTEEVPWTKSETMNKNLFAQIQAATRNAGRGDVLAWRAVVAEVALERDIQVITPEKVERK